MILCLLAWHLCQNKPPGSPHSATTPENVPAVQNLDIPRIVCYYSVFGQFFRHSVFGRIVGETNKNYFSETEETNATLKLKVLILILNIHIPDGYWTGTPCRKA